MAGQIDDERLSEFMRLFTSHEIRLRAFAISMVSNYADAEDILQEANMVMWKKFDQFQSGTSFMAWGGRVVYLAALRHRQNKKRNPASFCEDFYSAMANVALREDVTLQLGEQEHALSECIGKLSPQQRRMIQARYMDNVTVNQMSTMFNRSVQAVYKALNRTRQALFECVSSKISQGGF